jgi:hypothetical protein
VPENSLNSLGPTLTAIFALIALIAIGAAFYFWRGQQAALIQVAATRAQATRTERNFKASETAVNSIVSDLAAGLGSPGGLQAQDMAAVLTRVEKTIDTQVTETENEPSVQRSQGAMYVQLSATYLVLGNTKLALDSARKGTGIFRALAATAPNNDDMQSDVGLSLAKLAEALRANGDIKGALAADRESLEIARSLASKEPGNRQFRTDVVLALWRLASAGDDSRARLIEALKILNNLKLAAMLTPAQEEWIGMITREVSNATY